MTATGTVVPGRVGVVGLGLIGGSFARALHRGGTEVLAWNRTRSIYELARVETVDGELEGDAVGTCELIVLTTYPAHSVAWLEEHARLVSPDAVVIDACGVKRGPCGRCLAVGPGGGGAGGGAPPQAGPPITGGAMAGTQYSGFAHARADLFEGAPLVLCPPPGDPVENLALLDRVAGLLAPCGFGSVTVATPEEHDGEIAHTSQLAHVVSSAYVKSPRAASRKGFSAGSWRDLTRVASLNAPMWSELFLANADNLVDEIDLIVGHLTEYRDAIAAGDREALEALLEEGNRAKEEADR